MSVRAAQEALRANGFDPGPIDGVMGARTRDAVRAFQRSMGLVQDGILGPKTRQALLPDLVGARLVRPDLEVVLPTWLRHAVAEIGVRETAGRDSTGRIIDYRILGQTTHDFATEDGARPWCADFANAMLEVAGLHGTRSGMARSFDRSDHFRRLAGPAIGAITVFWRGSRASGLGHVGFCAGAEASGRLAILGGNQKDAVTVAAMASTRLVGHFWPAASPPPITGPFPAIAPITAREGREV